MVSAWIPLTTGCLLTISQGRSTILSHLLLLLIPGTKQNGTPVTLPMHLGYALLACTGLLAPSVLGHCLEICRGSSALPQARASQEQLASQGMASIVPEQRS